jgi:hypothetical protein
MNRQEALAEARLCERSAKASSDPEHRSALLELAGWWSQQADWHSRALADGESPACRHVTPRDA